MADPVPEGALRFLLVPGSGNAIELGPRPLSLGRSTDNDLIVADGQASKMHARIEPFGEGFRLVDLGSRNGTFVNGDRVQKAVLQPDDEIRIGGTVFRVRVESADLTGEALLEEEEEEGVDDVPEAPTAGPTSRTVSGQYPKAAEPPAPAPPPVAAAPPLPLPPTPKPPPPPPPPPVQAESAPEKTTDLPRPVLDAGGSETGAMALKKITGNLAGNLAAATGPEKTRRVLPDEIAAALLAARGLKAAAADEQGPTGTRNIAPEELADLSKTSIVSTKPPAAAAAPAPAPPPAAAKPPEAAAAAPAKPATKPPAPKSPEEQMLRSLPIFGEASGKPMGDLLKSLADEGKDERAEFRVFAPGAVVCREGEYTSAFFVILSGLAGVFKADAQAPGGRRYLASLPGGRWFGEMSCMSNAARSATVIAESDLVVLSVPRHLFMQFYEDRTSRKFRQIVDEEYRKRALTNHLGSVALFRGLDAAVLQRLSGVAALVVVEKGQVVVGEGHPGDAMYLVRTGHAKVTRRAGPKEEIVAWLRENSFFGEASLLRKVPRNSSVVAVDRMDLVKLPAEGFLKVLEEFPAVKERILESARKFGEQEILTADEAESRRRAREIGTEHEVIKAGQALVIDLSKCTRCNMCVEGCVEAHADHVPRIGKRGIQYGDLLLTSSCYNCQVPDCMLACGFGALRRDRTGQVQVDTDSCVGCGLCEPACPYGTIHMQSRVDESGLTTKASASPVKNALRSLPLVGRLFGAKAAAAPAPEAAPAAAAPAAPGAAPAAGAAPAPAAPAAEKPKAGGNVGKAMAVKCDLCAGRSDMACIASCPCGAIERIDPSVLLGTP